MQENCIHEHIQKEFETFARETGNVVYNSFKTRDRYLMNISMAIGVVILFLVTILLVLSVLVGYVLGKSSVDKSEPVIRTIESKSEPIIINTAIPTCENKEKEIVVKESVTKGIDLTTFEISEIKETDSQIRIYYRKNKGKNIEEYYTLVKNKGTKKDGNNLYNNRRTSDRIREVSPRVRDNSSGITEKLCN